MGLGKAVGKKAQPLWDDDPPLSSFLKKGKSRSDYDRELAEMIADRIVEKLLERAPALVGALTADRGLTELANATMNKVAKVLRQHGFMPRPATKATRPCPEALMEELGLADPLATLRPKVPDLPA